MSKHGIDAPWVKKAVEQYNEMTRSHVRAFRRWHPEVAMHYVDVGPTVNYMLDNFEQFGAPDALCDMFTNLSCLWANDLHAGPKMQRAVAEKIYDTLDWAGFWGSVWLAG